MASKSEEIRQFFRDFPDATNTEVIEGLALKGIEVSVNLVNQVRHDYKHKKKLNSSEDQDEPLLRVKRLADDLGGVDRLIQLANLLKKLLRGEEKDGGFSEHHLN